MCVYYFSNSQGEKARKKTQEVNVKLPQVINNTFMKDIRKSVATKTIFMVISHPTNAEMKIVTAWLLFPSIRSWFRGEEYVVLMETGAFHLKADTVVMKRKATKPGGSGRKKSQVSPFRTLCFACEDRLVGKHLEMGSLTTEAAEILR